MAEDVGRNIPSQDDWQELGKIQDRRKLDGIQSSFQGYKVWVY